MASQHTTASNHNTGNTGVTQEPSYWGGVIAMSMCVFTLIASEFMPVSLLTPVAKDLQVTQGMAGQGIAISGACAVLTSLLITAIAGRMDRKHLLLLMTALMASSGVIVASAHSYTTYMAGRALIGVVIGGFWSMSAATAMRLVPEHQVSRALAIFNGGNALAVVVAAPMGSYLGAVLGWRGAFFCLVPVAAIVFVWQWISLPPMKVPPARERSVNVLRLLRTRVVALGMGGCGAFFMGQFALYTYVRPFLETVTHTSVPVLSLILFTVGLAGVIGTALIGIFIKRSLYISLMIIPVLMAAIALALVFSGGSVMTVAVLMGIWGLVATAAPVGWWTWIAQTLPDEAESGGGLMVAVVQMAIALGSTLGGLLFDTVGYQMAFSGSALLLLVSAALTQLTSRSDQGKKAG